jgi:hypothetical protein
MATKYTLKVNKNTKRLQNKYFDVTFIERIFNEGTDNPGLYTIIYGEPLQPEAKKITIMPQYTKNNEMAIQSVSIKMPDGGAMTCPYDMKNKELLIDETMWTVKGRPVPTKKEYELYNESIKAIIKFLRNEYVGRKLAIKPKFIDDNVTELCIVGDIKKY